MRVYMVVQPQEEGRPNATLGCFTSLDKANVVLAQAKVLAEQYNMPYTPYIYEIEAQE